MSPLEVKTYPDPCLRIKTKAVEQFDRDIEDTLRLMADIMYIDQGIGLAATQVGLGLSMMVVDIGDGLTNFVNPFIVDKSGKKFKMEEGCLSLPGVLVNVSRPKKIKVKAQDAHGDFFTKSFDGLTATAIQHELDHLSGRLIIDYLDPFRYFVATRRLAKRQKDLSRKLKGAV